MAIGTYLVDKVFAYIYLRVARFVLILDAQTGKM
jgi:hypothetical protein